MILSSNHIFVNLQDYHGILKLFTIKEFHNIIVGIELHKITTSDPAILSSLSNNCQLDPTNPNLLRTVSTELKWSRKLTLLECEQLSKTLSWITRIDLNKQQGYWVVSLFDELQIQLHSDQIFRLYNFVYGFYSGYVILDTYMRLALNSNQNVPFQPLITSIDEEKSNSNTENIVSGILPSEQKDIPITYNTDETIISFIFSCCLTPSIQSILLHYIFQYYIYIESNSCTIQQDDKFKGKIQIITPNIFPTIISFDETFIKTLILSTSNFPFENINHFIKKLLTYYSQQTVLDDNPINNKPLYMMALNFLLLIYFLKYLHEDYPDKFYNNLLDFVYVEEKQTNVLNFFIKRYYPEFFNLLSFKILSQKEYSDIVSNKESRDDIIIDEENYSKVIFNELNEKYKYLIPISQEDYASTIVNNLEKIDSNNLYNLENIRFNKKKIINVSNILENMKNIKKTTVKNNLSNTDNIEFSPTRMLCGKRARNVRLFDVSNSIAITDDLPDFNHSALLYYYDYSNGSNERIISNAYKLLLNYIKNNTSILAIDDNEIPKEIKNLFPTLSSKILLKEYFPKDCVSTFNYWKIVSQHIPNVRLFNETTILYIVFQLVIPFYYDVYRISQFVDVLL